MFEIADKTLLYKAWLPLWVNMKQDELIFEDDFLFHVFSQ